MQNLKPVMTACLSGFVTAQLFAFPVAAETLKLKGTLYGQDSKGRWGNTFWELDGNIMRAKGRQSACPNEKIRVNVARTANTVTITGSGCRTTWNCSVPVGGKRMNCKPNRYGSPYVTGLSGW